MNLDVNVIAVKVCFRHLEEEIKVTNQTDSYKTRILNSFGTL